jgi:hypothetical protein
MEILLFIFRDLENLANVHLKKMTNLGVGSGVVHK